MWCKINKKDSVDFQKQENFLSELPSHHNNLPEASQQ
jgi:hypothetical protein